MAVEWRAVSGYEGIYEVSSDGQVRRIDINHKSHPRNGVLRPSMRPNGYLKVTLFLNNVRDCQSVHSVVARAFIGVRPPGCQVDHRDGNKLNNHYSNLEYVTPKVNTNRHIERRLATVGKRRSDSKLTVKQVHEIRNLTEQGITRAEIGRRYNVAAAFVSQIVSGVKWTRA